MPPRLTFALAALMAFYRGERDGQTYPLQDDAHWLERYSTLWNGVKHGDIKLAELVNTVLSDTAHWGQDLTAVPQLANQVTEQLQTIIDSGMRAAVAAYS